MYLNMITLVIEMKNNNFFTNDSIYFIVIRKNIKH